MIRAKTPPDHRCMGCGPKTSIAGASAATIDQMIPAYGATWQPYKERLRTVVLRNGVIAIVLGALVARLWGGLARWPLTTLLMLWPSFGGHWLEVWFLNWLRPQLATASPVYGTWRANGCSRWGMVPCGWRLCNRHACDGDRINWASASALLGLVARRIRFHRDRIDSTSRPATPWTPQLL